MRSWFPAQRATFRAMSDARRTLIESKALNGASFLTRLRFSRVGLVLSFVSLEGGLYAKRPVWRARELYYRATDRLFKDGRYKKYADERNMQYQKAVKALAEANRKLQTSNEELFEARVLEQSIKNPHFVAANRPHPDRQ